MGSRLTGVPCSGQEPAADSSAVYELRVRGQLDPAWGEVFELELTLSGDRTRLVGALDQSALHRVLRQIADLGLVLESLERRSPEDSNPVAKPLV